jgi:hypothetical protein
VMDAGLVTISARYQWLRIREEKLTTVEAEEWQSLVAVLA